jgi:hypothetical protein
MGSNDTVRVARSLQSKDDGSSQALAAAKRSLEIANGKFRYGNLKLEGEFYDLGLLTPQERFVAVDIALSQIKPEDRCGPDPPGDVSFPPYPGRTLYAFKWYSTEFKSFMYMKFCITGTGGMELLVLYSFHKDRP